MKLMHTNVMIITITSYSIDLAPHPFNMDIDVDVTFLRNGTPMASITFEVSHYII